MCSYRANGAASVMTTGRSHSGRADERVGDGRFDRGTLWSTSAASPRASTDARRRSVRSQHRVPRNASLLCALPQGLQQHIGHVDLDPPKELTQPSGDPLCMLGGDAQGEERAARRCSPRSCLLDGCPSRSSVRTGMAGYVVCVTNVVSEWDDGTE